MKKLIFAAAAVLVISLSGCIRQDAVKFHGVEDVSLSIGSTIGINARLSLENTSCRTIKVSDALFHITDINGNEIGTLFINETLVLPKKGVWSVDVPLKLRLANPLMGMALLRNIESEASRLSVTGSAVFKAGGAKKKYTVENMPISRFIYIFGADAKPYGNF